MKFFLAMFLWALMGLVLTVGLVMAVNGKFLVLGASVLIFVAMVAKIGCLTHD